jgi:hypothetical protein
MKICQYIIVFGLLHVALSSHAQIAPGLLIDEHADLEGITNCTQCHVLGEGVSSAKCLDCHDEIQSLIDQARGFHFADTVQSLECADCHSDHHGRDFKSTAFDQDHFQHDLTGYVLKGQHAEIECSECHQPKYIGLEELAGRENTFLGLEKPCLACHDDFHQGSLADDCASCHDIEAFRPAPFFDHDSTAFALVGKHIDVDCLECHPITVRNGEEFQEFTDVEFADCVSCHEDVHKQNLAGECTQCHVETSFSDFTGDRFFDHNSTSFGLKGAHSTVACFDCHTQTSEVLEVFQDRLAIEENQCASCHEDAHEERLGLDCAACHAVSSWFEVDTTDFDHDKTAYPLEGLHEEVSCSECHTEEHMTADIDFEYCFNCHEDYHDGQFTKNAIQRDCAECHSTLIGFAKTLYTVEQHNETDFILDGAHVATPCFDCHLGEEDDRWVFVDLGKECVDCHEDVHNGQFILNDANDCARCHDSASWNASSFDHDNTNFPLEGQHALAECEACHQEIERNGISFIEYKIEKFECVDCHQYSQSD